MIAGIREKGDKQRIARFDEAHQVYHDIFVYPENAFDSISDEHLCMSDGIVVLEKAHFGTELLKKTLCFFNYCLSPSLLMKLQHVECGIKKCWQGRILEI
ncbi:hypothetical protein N750_15920 [Legionella pneumophila str. Leg01/53]|nr:hypothetical protein N750_15920 [Legionella pneumophila str. Leg01/53]